MSSTSRLRFLVSRSTWNTFKWTALAFAFVFLNGKVMSEKLCFDLFLEVDDPVLQCADADYFIDDVGGGADFTSFVGSDSGELEAEFDGFDLFDDPDIEVPDSLLEPFFSKTSLETIQDATGQTTGFDINHRGSVSLTPRDSDFQSAAYQTRSRITFRTINTADPDAPIAIDLDIDFDFTLVDPIENATTGAALGGLGVKLLMEGTDPAEPDFDFSALAQLDVDLEEPDLEEDLDFFGFDDPELDDGFIEIDIEPIEPDIDDGFEIEIDIELELDLDDELMSGDEVTIEIDTFGSIFSDGFESGDTSAWKAASPDTMRLVLTSPDPNVTFVLVPEPSSNLLLLLGIVALIRRRR